MDHCELPGRRLAHHFEFAITAARKGLRAVELRCINASTNGKVGHDLAVVGIHDDELLRISAAHEEKPFFLVIGIPTRAPPGATGQRAISFLCFRSTTATRFLSARVMYALPASSVARNSGLPQSSIGESIFPWLRSTSGATVINTPLSPETARTLFVALSKEAKISMQQAEKTALAKEPGTIKSKELEKENGKVIYSFDIRTKTGILSKECPTNNGPIYCLSIHGIDAQGFQSTVGRSKRRSWRVVPPRLFSEVLDCHGMTVICIINSQQTGNSNNLFGL